MAKRTYKGSIELGKIDKPAIYTNDAGRKFLQFVFTVDDENEDQYGNVGSIRQDLGRDRRKEDAVWLGKVKPLVRRDNSQGGGQRTTPPPARTAAAPVPPAEDDGDYVPF